MKVRTQGHAHDLSAELVAAVVAAVESFMSGEARGATKPASVISAWRLANDRRQRWRGFGANVTWTGRDLLRTR